MSQEALHFMLPADAGWLAAEKPENPLITTVMLRVQGLTPARLREFLRIYWSAWERFRFRPEPCAGYWRWQASDSFDVRQHLDIVLDRFNLAQQQLWVSGTVSQPLPVYRPLWKFWLLPNAEGGALLLLRLHRCYADGPSLNQLLEQLFTQSPQQHPVLYGAPHPADLERWMGCAKSWLSERVFGPDGPAPATEAESARSPAIDLPAQLKAGAATALELAAQLGRYLAQPDDSPSRLSASFTGRRQCCWSVALPFAPIQTAADRLGVSTRDVLIACITAALQAQLGLSSQQLDEARVSLLLAVDVREQLPASLRPALAAPGNGCGSLLLQLPVDGASFIERVYRVKHEARRHRDSTQPLLTWGLNACSALLPEMIRYTQLWPGPARPSASYASVNSAEQPRYLAGCRIDEMVMWSPQISDAGISITACRYAGELRLAVMADTAVGLDVQAFQNDVTEALQRALATQHNPG